MVAQIELSNDAESAARLKFHGFGEGGQLLNKSVTVNIGAPVPISMIRDALYFPEFDCLYDSEGRRISESCIRRRTSLLIKSRGPETVDVPLDCTRYEAPIVYVGMLGWSHWGHFLTEGISRLWSLKNVPALAGHRALFHGPPALSLWHHAQSFLTYCGIEANVLIRFNEPVRLSEVILPAPSMVNQSHIYTIHTLCPGLVADHLLGRVHKPPSNQPVYLSRNRLGADQRRIVGENTLETFLSAAGYRIVYPEQLSFEQQVTMFNSHKTFVGCFGSALHSVLFVQPDIKLKTVTLYGQQVNRNNMMIDKAMMISADYIMCLSDDTTSRKPGAFQDQILDLDAGLFYLRSLGLL